MWETLKAFFKAAWEAIKNTATTVWNAIKDFFSGLWEGIKNIFTTVVNAITTFLSTAWNGIKNSVTTVWNAMSYVFSAVRAAQGSYSGGGVNGSELISGIDTALNTALAGGGAAGDIVIPVYIGGDMIDEIVVTAQQRMNLRSGGGQRRNDGSRNYAEGCGERRRGSDRRDLPGIEEVAE